MKKIIFIGIVLVATAFIYFLISLFLEESQRYSRG
jgi:hypothetical protein